MKNQLFFIEVSNNININDYSHIRKLYLPLIGSTAAIFYEYLIDIANDNFQNMYDLKEISKHFQISLEELSLSIIHLEAVGLIKKYIKNDNSIMILSLEKPLNIEGFNKNSLLKNHLIKKIGINNYEQIVFSKKPKTINKADFIDVTKKYQDVYLDNFQDEISDDKNYSTLDLVVQTHENHDVNIEKLPSTHFIKYLLKRNASFYEIQLINTLLKLGFSDPSINVLLDFSFKQNERIVCSYILTIAQDFCYRSIMTYNEVKHEIAIVEASKKKKYYKNKPKYNNELDIDYSTKDDKINEEEFVSSTKEISINDVFSEDDMKEMF